MENLDTYIEIGFIILAVVAALTPTENDDKALGRLRNLLRKIGIKK